MDVFIVSNKTWMEVQEHISSKLPMIAGWLVESVLIVLDSYKKKWRNHAMIAMGSIPLAPLTSCGVSETLLLWASWNLGVADVGDRQTSYSDLVLDLTYTQGLNLGFSHGINRVGCHGSLASWNHCTVDFDRFGTQWRIASNTKPKRS